MSVIATDMKLWTLRWRDGPPSESSELQVVRAYLWDQMVLKNMCIGSWVFISRERLTDYALLCRSVRSYKTILKSSRRLAGQMDLWAHVQEDRTGYRRAKHDVVYDTPLESHMIPTTHRRKDTAVSVWSELRSYGTRVFVNVMQFSCRKAERLYQLSARRSASGC